MRWDALFDDLEAQAAVLDQAERAAEVEDRTRGEVGTLGLRDRARAAVGTELRLQLVGGAGVRGVIARVGPDWLLLDEGDGREAVVATAQIVSVRGLGRYSAVPGSAGIVESRVGLRHALRGIARDRSTVRVQLVDGSTVDATIDRIGADFVEVATHPAGEPRRRVDVREIELLPIAAIASVRRAV
jgi:molybdopterin-binding protein